MYKAFTGQERSRHSRAPRYHPSIRNSHTKIPPILQGCLFFAMFKKCCLFTTRFLAKHQCSAEPWGFAEPWLGNSSVDGLEVTSERTATSCMIFAV
jgi:hypothetical protein